MTGIVADAESRAAALAGVVLFALVLSALALGLAGDAGAKPVTVSDLLAGSPAED